MRVQWCGEEWDLIDPDDMLIAEQVAIEKHLNCGSLEDMTSAQTVLGLVYVTIRRHLPQFSWKTLEGLTRREFDDLLVLTDEEQAQVAAARGDGDPPFGAPPVGAPSVSDSADTSEGSPPSSAGIPETSSV